MNRIMLTAAITMALALTACSSSPAVDDRECLGVDAGVLQAIAEGSSGVEVTPVSAAAVKSSTFADAYIVAMAFDAPGGDTEVGVWSTTSLVDGPLSILAVDGTAQSFTTWPGEVNGQRLDVTEDGVAEAKACLVG